jgi:L-serine deaminase
MDVGRTFDELDGLRAENERLQALVNAQEAKVRELEDTIAACVKAGARLHAALKHYDGPGPIARRAREMLKELEMNDRPPSRDDH